MRDRVWFVGLRRAGSSLMALGLDVIASKLGIPPVGRESVSRTPLVNRLRAAGTFPVVVIVAPAGYGKTTLLAQWARKDARPFAWIAVDERDNEPVLFLRHLAAAIDRVEPLDPSVREALARRDESIWNAVVPRLTSQLAARETPLVLVFDDVDRLESDEALAALGATIENVPPGSMVALAGRTQPRVPIPALRADAPLLELGAYELAFSRREAELLLKASAVEPDEETIAQLMEETEGWATGLYLAALALREDSDAPAGSDTFPADDRYVTDYLRCEYLAELPPELRGFLRRTSVLEKLSAPLCDAVLETTASAAKIAAAEHANLFLVPLDRNRRWYRYHRFFRDLLRRELEDTEPELVSDLNRRAAAWYEAHGDPESAIGHAYAGGDSDRTARLLSSIALELNHAGHVVALEHWLGRFDDDDRLEQYPDVAVHGSRIHAVRGRPEEATRWLAAAERGARSRRKGIAAVRPWIAVVRSSMCSEGPAQMRVDAERARRALTRGAAWRPSALLVEAAAALLLGDELEADRIFGETIAEAERSDATETKIVALGERSLLAADRGDYQEAEEYASDACRLVEERELGSYATSALALAASARANLRHGRWDKARNQLTLADELASNLTHALPWLGVQVRLELGHAYVTLRDRERAERLLDESRLILRAKPKLGVLTAAVEELATEIAGMPTPERGRSSGLTAAELRLLPLLSTHLSFREIGQRLFVSRNTIKTQAISVYRKLGVSSRSEAIERAMALGLVDADDPAAGAVQADSVLRSVS